MLESIGNDHQEQKDEKKNLFIDFLVDVRSNRLINISKRLVAD